MATIAPSVCAHCVEPKPGLTQAAYRGREVWLCPGCRSRMLVVDGFQHLPPSLVQVRQVPMDREREWVRSARKPSLEEIEGQDDLLSDSEEAA